MRSQQQFFSLAQESVTERGWDFGHSSTAQYF
jgi:hypothetical protein